MSNIYSIILEPGRNLADVAMQVYGSIDGLLKLCTDNGIEMGQNVEPGTVLLIDASKIITKQQVYYYLNKGIIVASGGTQTTSSNDWILSDGTWNDSKFWNDTKTWRDN